MILWGKMSHVTDELRYLWNRFFRTVVTLQRQTLPVFVARFTPAGILRADIFPEGV